MRALAAQDITHVVCLAEADPRVGDNDVKKRRGKCSGAAAARQLQRRCRAATAASAVVAGSGGGNGSGSGSGSSGGGGSGTAHRALLLQRAFDDAFAFIEVARADNLRNRVLICSNAPPAAAAAASAYIARADRLPFTTAWDAVARPHIVPTRA
ncbi:hypothetical protein JKP88DRAFT_283001 [Tribonema minus]|uniref:Uncharacterized protein n=1 Tax=Tribonema minus TaxID=303371 RepID=A0A836C9C5_9STRA|nr:hypothetical protein JKP88DRAFT_283001 [Tribonema minus]